MRLSEWARQMGCTNRTAYRRAVANRAPKGYRFVKLPMSGNPNRNTWMIEKIDADDESFERTQKQLATLNRKLDQVITALKYIAVRVSPLAPGARDERHDTGQ